MSPLGVTRVPVVGSALAVSVLIVPCLVSRPAAQEEAGIRRVAASPQMLIPLQTRLRYTTMIVLPEEEEILDVVCGDKDFWVISATHNIAHVKPAKDGAATNLNLVTTSGAVYSFLLNEKGGASTPDLKVYVNVNADPSASVMKPKYYTATQFDGMQAELLQARTTVEAEHRRAAEVIATYQQEYPAKLQFVYGTPKYRKPFLVRAIWHDGQFTYLKTDATELPALYEVKDGKPALVNFQVRNGIYVIPKVVERGYLALGKTHFSFAER
jgi:type IV secretory pathway VirB9-like protein